jgi:hypothetical protein
MQSRSPTPKAKRKMRLVRAIGELFRLVDHHYGLG